MNKFKNAKITAIVFAIIIFGLICNIVYLGATGKHLISGDNIREFAENRGVKTETEYATRGQIYTSDKEAIATNVKKYKIIAVLSNKRPGYGKTAAHVTNVTDTGTKLASVLGCDANVLIQKMQVALDTDKYQIEFGSLGRDLSTTTKNQIEALNLNGIEFEEYNGRYYPYGDFCSYMVGYTSNTEVKGIHKLVGAMGFELKLDKSLKGSNGYKVYQTDSAGYTLPDGMLESKKSVDGNDVYLTIDSSLQRDLDLLMNEAVTGTKAEYGICSVMDVKTGKILAVSSYPSYNPNDRNIANYTNYFIDATFECGSVFKPFIYADSIEEGKYNHNAYYNSGTYAVNYGGKTVATIRDHNNGQGWGSITFDQGLYHSSNVAICNLLDNGMVTKDVLKENLKKLGFFQESDLDGMKTAKGIAAYDRTDTRLEYLTTGFGQGSTTTAYQLLQAYSVFGNNGKTVKPYIVDRIVNPKTNKVVYSASPSYSKQIFSENTIKEMKDLMLGVVEQPVGTGKIYKMDNTRIIGKTGTGQVSGPGGYRSDIAMHSFACLAPYDDPQIVVYLTLKCGSNYGEYTPKIIKSIVPEALQVVNAYNSNDDTKVSDTSVRLDSYTNQSIAYVKSKLESKGLSVQTIGGGGSVVDQSPLANTKVAKGSRVFLKSESSEIALPDMTGYSRKDVTTFASLSGLKITIQGNSGLVVNQDKPAGTVVHSGDTIIVALNG